MTTKTTYRFKPESLKDFAQNVLVNVSVPKVDAEIVADTLVDADLKGVASHGFLRLDLYVKRIECGSVNSVTKLEVVNDKGATLVLDAGNGLGQVAGKRGMEMAIERAKKSGVSVVSIRNSHHFGMAAYYSEMAAAEGMVGIVATNAVPLIPAIGGLAPVTGTNPISFAVPTDKEPIVLDMSCSSVAQGKIVAARDKGEKVPLGWGTDKKGVPTQEPSLILDGGLILPAAGPKGFGLALIVDILTGGLSGGALGNEINSIYKDMNAPNKVSHIFMAINVSNFIDLSGFKTRITKFAEKIHSGPKAEGTQSLFVPGEIEYLNKKKNIKEGLPLSGEVYQKLKDLGQRFDVSVPISENI